MASPMPHLSHGGLGGNEHMSPRPQPGFDESALQCRPMGLKVHYTFDREAKVNCLARYPQTLQVQTVPIDERNSIGVIDLRHCIEAVSECSPELAGQNCDYTIYAHDYSEPDTPLVGQGMLSKIMETMQPDAGSATKLVTGRVTRNVLAVFAGGNRETLEVKLRFTETAISQKRSYDSPRFVDTGHNTPHHRPTEGSMTPTGTTEWNSFIQSNPQLGQSSTFPRDSSPAISQGPSTIIHDSFNHAPQPIQIPPQSYPHSQQNFQRIAPTPIDPSSISGMQSLPPSRPSSRASNSSRTSRKKAPKKPPTGRPVGRPRKQQPEPEYPPPPTGNTSGYEDGTEGEDGPAKKRVKTTRVEKAKHNPFVAGPDSLRVAASTSGSLRNFRPIGMNPDGASSGSHLQEAPRAPTPVPKGPGGMFRRQESSRIGRESWMGRESFNTLPSPTSERPRALTPSQQDGRSPDSEAPTPADYSDSPATFVSDIGSSPPIPRRMTSFRSSPAPSSPVLPPMPRSQAVPPCQPVAKAPEQLLGEGPTRQQTTTKTTTSGRPRKVVPQPGTRGKAAAVPMQVFRMEDGPDGQEMVHVMSYNNADAIDVPAPPPWVPPETTKPKASTAKKGHTIPPPPILAPTPPPTTDAVEKPPTPDMYPEFASVPTPVLDAPLAHLHLEPSLGHQPTPHQQPIPPIQCNAHSVNKPFTPPQDSGPTVTPPDAPAISQLPPPVAGPTTEAIDTALTEPTPAIMDDQTTAKPKPKPRARSRKPLARSQSSGLAGLPTEPASEPAGPGSSSYHTRPSLQASASTGLLPAVPASDPIGPSSLAPLCFPRAPSPLALPPSSPPLEKCRKNQVKKHAIKQRLELAIMNGELPPFCSNCGAIETPTWRKIWIQDREGAPEEEVIDKGVKPGQVTALFITGRDANDKPTTHRIIKKVLAHNEDKDQWQDIMLCNPCGIWLAKNHVHRPQDRWDKDASRLGQERNRKKRVPGSEPTRPPRSRKPKPKVDEPQAVSDVSHDPEASNNGTEAIDGSAQPVGTTVNDGTNSLEPSFFESKAEDDGNAATHIFNPGSTRSRGNGTAKSPIALDILDLDDAMGSTKRLLFPSSPNRSKKVLGLTDVNIVLTSSDSRVPKELDGEKENSPGEMALNVTDELEALFRSPLPPRPSTPPANKKTGGSPSTPFKTPTRATPNHRPITRSVSRSIRSLRSGATLRDSQRTPTKTPRGLSVSDTPLGFRRSPRNHDTTIMPYEDEAECYTPVSRAISQMLSDNPILSDPNFGGFRDDVQVDFDDLPPMQATTQGMFDMVNNWFSTDGVAPTSPEKNDALFDYDGTTSVFDDWNIVEGVPMEDSSKVN